jgi:pantoate ligase/cytidylate kinase
MQRARQENRWVVVSIFVNPLQFAPGEDFQKYPRTLEQDRILCQEAGVDAIFAPTLEALFSEKALTQVTPPPSMTEVLCGRSRLGHFQGVATIVTKLLHLVQPDRIYFGQKDAQQLAILQRLVADLNFPTEVVPCPIVRTDTGLAYSSRNQYLTPIQQQQATALYGSLQQAQKAFRAGIVSCDALIKTVQAELALEPAIHSEYVELVDSKTLMPLEKIEETGLLAIAAHLGNTRLIDNTLLDARQPILAVDGPAGAGKSTVTRLCAQELGLLYLDTGAMYRAVTWLVQQSGIAVQDQVAIAELVSQCQIQLILSHDSQSPLQVLINGQEVTQQIRSLPVTAQVSAIAAQPAVRQALVKQQQQYGKAGGVAIEGRDIGTYVFPDAGLKIFLTASVQERARRRQQELKTQGNGDLHLAQLEQEIWERDQKDSQRSLAPLRKATDAVEIATDGLTIVEVTTRIVALYRERFS